MPGLVPAIHAGRLGRIFALLHQRLGGDAPNLHDCGFRSQRLKAATADFRDTPEHEAPGRVSVLSNKKKHPQCVRPAMV